MLSLLITTELLGLLQLYWALGTQETARNSCFKNYCVLRKEMDCLLAYSVIFSRRFMYGRMHLLEAYPFIIMK